MVVKFRIIFIFILFFIFIYLQSLGIGFSIAHAEFIGDGNTVITGAVSGRIVGEIFTIDLIENLDTIAGGKTGTTISGTSAYGTFIRGNSASEVTVVFTSAVKGMSSIVHIDRQTSISGATINVLFEEGDTLRAATDIVAGASKYTLSGNTNAQRLIIWSSGQSEYTIIEVGAPTVGAD